MSRNLPPNVKAWLAEPLPQDVLRAVERVASGRSRTSRESSAG
jgi:hypothetical protein